MKALSLIIVLMVCGCASQPRLPMVKSDALEQPVNSPERMKQIREDLAK